MLQRSHVTNRHAKPMLARMPVAARSFDDIYREMGATHEPREGAIEVRRVLGDAGGSSLDQLVESYLDLRDQLAYRRLRGDGLSPREHVLLVALNQLVDQVFPPRPGLPSHVNDLVDEVLRRR